MDSPNRTRANLKKYIKAAGQWRIVPVLQQNGIPVPGIVLIDGTPLRSTTGTFYLEFRENERPEPGQRTPAGGTGGADIDCECYVGGKLAVRPVRDSRAGSFKNPLTQGQDQARSLGQVDEFAGQ